MKKTLGTAIASTAGAAAVLAGASVASAFNHALEQSTHLIRNMANRTLTGSNFSIGGTNSSGTLTASVVKVTGGSKVTVTQAGSSLYARAYARCRRNSTGAEVAAYSAFVENLNAQATVTCSGVLGSGYTQVGFGALVASLQDSAIPTVSRKTCDGDGCGLWDNFQVSQAFLNYYPAFTAPKIGIQDPGVPGPTTAMTTLACW